MREREVSLLDLVAEILLHWRTIIVWMLVGAVLMGGFSYVNSARSIAAQLRQEELKQQLQQKEEEEQEEQTEEEGLFKEDSSLELTNSQKNNVQSVIEYERIRDFLKQSVLLKIDAANVPKSSLSFLVKTSAVGDSSSIERLYEDALGNGLLQWVQEQEKGLKVSDISELVMVTRGTGEVESDSFCVRVIHVTEEKCKELAQLIVEYIQDKQSEIAEHVGAHQIVLVNQSFAVAKDEDVFNQQRSLLLNILSYDSSVNTMIEEFTEEEKAYYEFLTNAELDKAEEEDVMSETDDASESVEEDVEKVEKSVPTPDISLKYVLLGMILFAFVYVFCLFIMYILDNRLRATDDISELYDIPQLGRIPAQDSKKKWFGFVDRLILKLRDRNRRSFTGEEALGLAGVAVKMAAKKEAFDAVCCIGCDMKDSVRVVAEVIQTALKEDGIEMNVLNNVLYDQSAMEQLQGVRGVFLLEKAGETLYDEILKEIDLLNRQEIKILGVVVVE